MFKSSSPIHIYICIYVYLNICIYIYVYIYICMYVYINIYVYIIKHIIPPSLDSSHPVFLPCFTPTKTARKAAECNDLRQLNAEAPDRQRQLFIEAVLENLTKNGDFMEVFM